MAGRKGEMWPEMRKTATKAKPRGGAGAAFLKGLSGR
jgi:hypothetical protein